MTLPDPNRNWTGSNPIIIISGLWERFEIVFVLMRVFMGKAIFRNHHTQNTAKLSWQNFKTKAQKKKMCFL